jgi:hypothetical protein
MFLHESQQVQMRCLPLPTPKGQTGWHAVLGISTVDVLRGNCLQLTSRQHIMRKFTLLMLTAWQFPMSATVLCIHE